MVHQNSPQDDDLVAACFQGNLELVKHYISQGANPQKARDKRFGNTCLHQAAKGNHLEICKYLVEIHHVDLSARENLGMTPLILATTYDHVDILKYLVEDAGANIDEGTHTNATATFFACQKGFMRSLRYLVEHEADMNKSINSGATPLLIACEKGQLDCVRYLCEQNAEVDKPKKNGVTPLWRACEKGYLEIVRFLVEHGGANLEAWDPNHRGPIHVACRAGWLEIARVLVRAGADVNATDHGGFTPLCEACGWGKADLVDWLLKNGADPLAAGWNGNNGLHLAAWKGYARVVELISRKLDVNIKNHYGFTALHLAGQAGRADVIEVLLKKKAQVSLRTCHGDTSLHLAIQSGNLAAVAGLLNAHADPSRKNIYGASCHHLARRAANGTRELLEEKGYPDPDPMCLRVQVLTPAARFASDANQIIPTICLDNVLVLRKEIILHSGEIPSYARCIKEGWHETAARIAFDDRVLFVSHRWGSTEESDPTNAQYDILHNFLNSQRGAEITWVWVDDACICQDKDSAEFKMQLSNIPTAVWCATHFLIIPKVVPLAVPRDPEDMCPATDLKDYVSRAWCLMEVFAAMMTATRVFCSFQLGGQIHHEPFDQPQGATSSLGFYQAKVNVWNRLLRERSDDWLKADKNGLSAIRDIVEPCRVLGLLVSIATKGNSEYAHIMEKARTLGITLDDVEEAGGELLELWEGMGQTHIESDKVIVLNLTLFIGFYSMGKVIVNEDETAEAFDESPMPASNECIDSTCCRIG